MSLHSSYGPNPLENLPLTDPRCKNDSCTAFQAAHNASQATVSYTRQFEYGHWVSWYYAIIIFFFSILHFFRLYTLPSFRTRSHPPTHSQLHTKATAAIRYLTYRRPSSRILLQLGLPSTGLLALLLLSILFLTTLTFAARPYYRGHRGYGSPPLAVRTGLMAAACTPLIVLLSGKANGVMLLTGVGHERLNVLHRWVGCGALGLSVVHTVPFLVAPVRDGGWAELRERFYAPGGFEYTGVPPLAVLAGISLFSIPYIRHRFYEPFYFFHIALYVAYLGLCFWHFSQEGDSWNYLWATLAIWLSSVLARVFWFNRSFNVQGRWMVGSPMEVQKVAGEMTRLDVLAPPGVKWRPGQHFFLRMPGLDILGNHPFTVASAFREVRSDDGEKWAHEPSEQLLTFYIRQHAGFTNRLAAFADREKASTAWLEGPYGGIPYMVENKFDHIILVAGGGGVTACLPWLEYLAGKKAGGLEMQTQKVTFVWMVRRIEHLAWADDSLEKAKALLGEDSDFIEKLFHVTDGVAGSKQFDDIEASVVESVPELVKSQARTSKEAGERVSGASLYKIGRPRIAEILSGLVLQNSQTLVIGCGPESLKIDISNACADLQRRVLREERGGVALHTETFGW